MLRSGCKLRFVLLVVAVTAISAACTTVGANGCREYGEDEMGELATFVRVSMNIVSSNYTGPSTPAQVPEEKIKEIIKQRGAPFKELELLDKYELMFVSRDGQWGAVAWNPENDQKLLQDLRCTNLLDEHSWKTCIRGREFTLDWRTCN
jgi:hypothetical protein